MSSYWTIKKIESNSIFFALILSVRSINVFSDFDKLVTYVLIIQAQRGSFGVCKERVVGIPLTSITFTLGTNPLSHKMDIIICKIKHFFQKIVFFQILVRFIQNCKYFLSKIPYPKFLLVI